MNRPPAAARRAEFEELYRQHSREVWALAFARWLDADLAMDVTQEAFLRLWRQWEAGEAIANPKGWLLRVARNLAEDQAKSSFRRNGTQAPDQLGGLASGFAGPGDSLEREELYAQLRVALEELAPADREILALRYSLDLDATAIADRLGVATSAVHMRLSRARQRLADRLSALGVVAPDLTPGTGPDR